jgi:WD40 repeat protein
MDVPREERMDPFVGPRPIQKGELLFGRDLEVRDLTDLLMAKRIVLLHSPSGAGKSSLVNAGLIPALVAEHFEILPVMRVNREPPALVAQVAAPEGVNRYVLSVLLSLESERSASERVDVSTLSSLSLDEYLEHRQSQSDADATVLILDQFEEILTVDPIDLPARGEFFAQLGQALRNRQRWALIAMREDYVGGLDPYLQPIPTQLSVRMRIDLLSRDGAIQAIWRPRPPEAAEDLFFLTDNFSPEAAEKLAEDLAQMRVQQPDGTRLLRPGPYVEPVQLQVVCKRLWEGRGEGMTQIDVDAIQDVGAVDEALAGYYADTVRTIAGQRSVPEWRVRDWFDRKLITAQGIRSQVMRGVVESEGLLNDAIDDLIRAYLVRLERRRGVTWYELAHDRLVDPILQNNERWRGESLSPYYTRAARWMAEDRPRGMLLRGSELEDMERWQWQHRGELTYEEEVFLEASQEVRDQVEVEVSREAERRTNLAETGWGVIMADLSLRTALAELLDHRRALAAAIDPDHYQEFAYSPGETTQQFLARHGVGTGALEPARVPFYLLIVGDPETIPWEFQYELDLQYAVGRIHFDTMPEYAAYARSVVAAERGEVALSPTAVLFGPQNPDDRAMKSTVNSVLVPMGERLQKAYLQPEWEVQSVLREQATKARLSQLLGGPETPALLVVLSHGLQFPPDDDRLLSAQGALLCQDWPGPRASKGPLTPEFYYAADDLPDEARLLGLVAFLSASYSAGTPARGDYTHVRGRKPLVYGRPFISSLPKRLLGHPRGGALAVCGHVDDPWLTEGGLAEMPIFSEVVRRLMDGHTVGSAMEVFDQRYAMFAARASEVLRQRMMRQEGDAEQTEWEVEALLTAMIDARNYVILGDPAVRLPVVEATQAAPRPSLEPVVLPAEPPVPEEEILKVEPKAPVAAGPAIRAAYVDLEIGLYRRDASSYGLAMRLTQPGFDAAVELASADSTLVRMDLVALEALAADPLAQGRRLSECLFETSAVKDAFRRARTGAGTQGIPLRLRLYLDPGAPELQALAWEAMDDPLRPGTALSLAAGVLFSRYDTSPDWRPLQLQPRASLKALVVVANPRDVEQLGFAQLDVGSELARAQASLGAIPTTTLAAPDHVTLRNLVSHLREGYDVLYLACHTAVLRGEPRLWLEDEEGNGYRVSGAELVAHLDKLAQMPRLVVLMARDAAILGPSLLEAGIPAVLAVASTMDIVTTQEFMAVFFREVMLDGLIDRAVAAARQAVSASGRLPWAAPALFMRSESGRLFVEGGFAAPFMAPPLPEYYVPRQLELERIVDLFLASPEGPPVVALTGAGGSGKTVLAAAVCHDKRVRDALADGVLWVTLGQQPDVVARLGDLVTAVTGDRPGFTSLEAVLAVWKQALGERRMLLVIDDVWEAEHLAPFLDGGPRCARLITTRNRAVVPSGAHLAALDAMRQEEAVRFLGAGLPEADLELLRPLAERLEAWPLALRLANATLRDRVLNMGQNLPDAVAYLHRTLDRRGLTAFDRRGLDRDGSLARSLDLVLERLAQDEAQRYSELMAFPEDTDVPLDAVQVLWGATAGLDASRVEALCTRFHDLSLLQDLDLPARRLRLHDLVRSYLLSTRVKSALVHERLLDAYHTTFKLERWADLPREEPYLWHHLAHHLAGAGELEGLRQLLLDFDWLQAKLEVAGVASLLADYGHAPRDDEALLLVRDALQLSEYVLAADPAQLAGQLLGRLSSYALPGIQSLLESARQWQAAPWLQPQTASLTPPGGPLLRTFVGHTQNATAVVVTPDGRRAISGSWDRTVRVWDLESGQLLSTLKGHAEGVTGVAVTPDARVAVSASNDMTLKVWDLAAGRELATLAGHEAPVAAVAVTPDGKLALSASGDATVRVWDLAAGQSVRVLQGHRGPVTALAVTPGGERVISASADGTLGIWDLATGESLLRLEGQTAALTGVAVTPDARLAIAASDGGTLAVWNLETGALLSSWQGHARGRTVVALSPDGRYLISASTDQTLRIWDLPSGLDKGQAGRELATLRGHAGVVTAVARTPDGRWILSASDDGTLKLWDLQRALEVQIEPAHGGIVHAVAFSPDGKRAISASGDGTLKIWGELAGAAGAGPEGIQVERTLEGHEDSVIGVAIAPDGKRAISTSFDQTLKVWDLGFVGRVMAYRKKLDKTTRDAYAAKDSRFRSFVDRGEALSSVDLPDILTAYALTPDGQRIVAASQHLGLKVWDLSTLVYQGLEEGKELLSLAGHDGDVWAIAVFDEGKKAISASEDGTLKVWDLDAGRELRTLVGHAGAVYAVVVFDGGRQAISASADTTLKVWSLESGEELATLVGHTGPVKAVAVLPDGRRAISASEDRTLRAWDLGTLPLPGHLATFGGDSAFFACAVSVAGLIVAGDQTGQVHFLRLVEPDQHSQ